MKIEIQGYWGAKVKSVKQVEGLDPEEHLKEHPHIHLCDIVIDGKVVGTVTWNGERLSIFDEWCMEEKEG